MSSKLMCMWNGICRRRSNVSCSGLRSWRLGPYKSHDNQMSTINQQAHANHIHDCHMIISANILWLTWARSSLDRPLDCMSTRASWASLIIPCLKAHIPSWTKDLLYKTWSKETYNTQVTICMKPYWLGSLNQKYLLKKAGHKWSSYCITLP